MDSIDKNFIEALFTADYYKGYKAMEEYIAKVVYGILYNMDITHYFHNDYRTVDEIVERFNLHAQSKPLLNWMLNYLERMGQVQNLDSKYKMNPITFNRDMHEEIKRIIEHMPTADIFIKLSAHVENEIENFFVGSKNGGEILFTNEAVFNLWNDFFDNSFYLNCVLNYGAAYGITKWFSRTKGENMLEIGSGTSGATVKVFQMLRDSNLLNSIDAIILTDFVYSLLELGKKNINKQILDPPRYEQKILDINKPFGGQEFSGDTFDIIYGVNVLHVARDLTFSLKEIYDKLNEYGMFVIAETIRLGDHRALHHEIIFNLLENYYDVKLDPEIRPYHGFLTKERWIRHFERAGFRNIEYLTESERNDELDFDIKPLHSFLVLKGQR